MSINPKNITLEMSLKPFKQTDEAYIEKIIIKLFDQWDALTRHAKMVSVMLWVGDGSEILEYRGKMEDKIEWGCYVGGATRKIKLNPLDPEQIGLHSRPYLYMDNPPVFTYALLRMIVRKIKEIGTRKLNKPVRVGATFDPGPEFAKSPFKYERHNEICLGDVMGKASFVAGHAILNTDNISYAGFPDGIPQDTPFGIFFGRQCQHFLSHLDFDYIWFSNGFGFGTETWGIRGTIFDGKTFMPEHVEQVQEDILSFWYYFRQECPDFRIETRGTNLSTGIDLAGDGVPLKQLYETDLNFLPPPNSPWAAINQDFGIELAGHMSRICELPEEEYPFRFYTHDPWWMNSPWLDRYGREAHDIFLPLALTRINEQGQACPPSHIQFLTVDNSLGGIPDQVPNEVIPHILHSLAISPDQPSPFVWVYPFDEYHELVRDPKHVAEPFFGDWFIRGAITQGFPLNTVVSTSNFLHLTEQDSNFFEGSILVSPVPIAGSKVEEKLLEIVKSGGQVLLYGPLKHASKRLLDSLNLAVENSIDGDLDIQLHIPHPDILLEGTLPTKLIHRPLNNAGGLHAVRKENDENTIICATASQGDDLRVISSIRNFKGKLGWVRGTVSSRIEEGHPLMLADDLNEIFSGESLMRAILPQFGYHFRLTKYTAETKPAITLTHRFKNGYFFSGFNPDTTTTTKLHFPQGAPLLLGLETVMKGGFTEYPLPRAWQRECRIFVEQEESSVLSYQEHHAANYRGKRKMGIYGLKDATVRFYPETGFEATTKVLLNSYHPWLVGDQVEYEIKQDPSGTFIEVLNITGWLVFTWDLPEGDIEDVDQLTAVYE